ncbi:hypothetical protein [Bacteroides timonensis]|uniref:hypothetical protein n=1 Tax=Bacteroides timonensis TaxID=1470345 RepID=UPI0004B6D007|nr:hypothetical protein [Bacteroides timonensis]
MANSQIVRFIKDWTLPLSMSVGAVCYLLFSHWAVLAPVKPVLVDFIPYLLPALIFAMLFLTYCKIDLKELRPKRYHVWLILIQLCGTSAVAAWLVYNPDTDLRAFGEAMMACIIAPMAAVGAVVTGKIGGNVATATTYTVISSLLTAVAVPVIYPLVEPGIGLSFIGLFWQILTKVFPTIVFPLVIALLLRLLVPKAHAWCMKTAKDKAFYLWAVCTAVNTAQIIRILVSGPSSGMEELAICLGAGVLCVAQFAIGKTIGSAYGDRISAGQSLGQKNTVLSIWIAMTFLTPEAAIAPGAYLMWQNIINSWQIWKHK